MTPFTQGLCTRGTYWFSTTLYAVISIFRYIYLPIIGNKSGVMYQLFGSSVTFIFVFLWHGSSSRILRWSVFKFIIFLIETAGRALWKNEMYQNMEKSFLSETGQRRLHAAVAGNCQNILIIFCHQTLWLVNLINIQRWLAKRRGGNWKYWNVAEI